MDCSVGVPPPWHKDFVAPSIAIDICKKFELKIPTILYWPYHFFKDLETSSRCIFTLYFDVEDDRIIQAHMIARQDCVDEVRKIWIFIGDKYGLSTKIIVK